MQILIATGMLLASSYVAPIVDNSPNMSSTTPYQLVASCPAGQISCAAWCQKYRDTAKKKRRCQVKGSKSCKVKFGTVAACVPDNPRRK